MCQEFQVSFGTLLLGNRRFPQGDVFGMLFGFEPAITESTRQAYKGHNHHAKHGKEGDDADRVSGEVDGILMRGDPCVFELINDLKNVTQENKHGTYEEPDPDIPCTDDPENDSQADAGEKKCGKELKRFTLNAGDVVQVVQKVSGDA